MALPPASRYVKHTLIIVNTICLIWALACLIVASFIFSKRGRLNNLPSDIDPYSLGYLLLIVGIITLIISSMGSFGSWREQIHCILSYAFILLCLIIIQSFVVGYTIHHKNDFTKNLTDFVHEEFGNSTNMTEVNFIQRKYMCCGIDGPKFWNETFPASCCSAENKTCTQETAFKAGCLEVLISYFKNLRNWFIGVTLGMIIFEIVSFMSSTYLAKEIRTRNQLYEEFH